MATIYDLPNFASNSLGNSTQDTSLNSHKLTNVSNPTSAQDAATKAYVDGLINGLNILPPVIAATTGALDANTPGSGTLTSNSNEAFPSVDGVTSVQGQLYLIKDEADASTNGVYALTTLGDGSTAWVLTRIAHQAVGAHFNGDFVFVEDGTANSGMGYVALTDGTDVVGSDDMTWTAFSSASAGITQLTGDVTAGPGSGSQAATIAAGAVTASKMGSGAAATNVGSLGGDLTGTLPNPTLLPASPIIYPTESPITAHSGGGQGSATQLTLELNNVTTIGASGDSVKLLASPTAGQLQRVVNAVGNASKALAVFPQSGGSIDGGSTNAAYSIPGMSSVSVERTFQCTDGTNWISF